MALAESFLLGKVRAEDLHGLRFFHHNHGHLLPDFILKSSNNSDVSVEKIV